MEKKKYSVSILNVNTNDDSVDVRFGGGSESTFKVVSPAQISYAKVGDADITVENNEVTYLRSKAGFSGNSGGGNSFQPKQNFQNGNTFKAVDDSKKQKLIVNQHAQKVAVEILKAYQSQESTNEVYASYPDYVSAVIDVAHMLAEDILKE